MAATTITRATITDDSGNYTSGTILNSAWFGTAIYDKIDALFSSFGFHTFETSGTGGNIVSVANTAAGTGNYAGFLVSTDSVSLLGQLYGMSSTYTPSGQYLADGVALNGNGAGGLSLAAAHASGVLRFYSGGTTKRGEFTAAGHLVLAELAANPGTSDLAADAAIAVYTKADKLVFAYNNGGTVTYITLDLDGSDTTWAHSTSAP